jgi:cystathionine beta-lyase
MSKINFDAITERRGTDSLKYDCAARRGMPEGLIPLWVADMDFKTPDPVVGALRDAAEHGVFGYTVPGPDYYEALTRWFAIQHDYSIDPNHVTLTPGVVFALAQAVRAFTKQGDAVLVQRPVYYPFMEVIEDNGRRLVNNALVQRDDGTYGVDFDDFERRLAEDRPKVFLLCSPHNPVGRVWTRDELARMGECCLKYGCLVVSDEIHCDFVYPGHAHTVFSNVREAFRGNSVICTAPSKTFNLAGLQISNIVIEDPRLRRRFRHEIAASGYSQPGLMGIRACRVAYAEGGPWLEELKVYLLGNLNFIRSYLEAHVPRIKLIEPEGTYLPWLDFRALGLTQEKTDDLLVKKAGVWLDTGTMFGPEGEGFQRINIACPRAVLEAALSRIAQAFG